ncbi:MAG: cytoplasmic protein [Syntrophales bacterium]
MNYEKVEVECYSGYKANERPMAFTHHGRRYEIAEIIDRWYEGGLDPARPKTDYFKVKTIAGDVFLLHYLSLFDAWSVRVQE